MTVGELLELLYPARFELDVEVEVRLREGETITACLTDGRIDSGQNVVVLVCREEEE